MIPKKGSIPGRQQKKSINILGNLGNLLENTGGLLGGTLKGLGKTLESVKNLSLEDLQKLADAQDNKEASQTLKELNEKLGEINIKDLFGEGLKGLDLSKLADFAAKHKNSSQGFTGGGIVRTGLSGRILGRPIGGGLPLNQKMSQEQETKFEVKGGRSAGLKTKAGESRVRERTKVHEIDFDPIEEKDNYFIIRGYLAGVGEEDIICEVQKNGTILRIAAGGIIRRYETEIQLPSKVTPEVKWVLRNGILEVNLAKEV